MKKEFIERITDDIDFAEQYNEDLDDYGFGSEKGIVISVNEAKAILKELNKIKDNSSLPVVSGSYEADYWSERCKLMENIEEESPCDPDITEKQINAYSKYHNFIKEKGQRNYR